MQAQVSLAIKTGDRLYRNHIEGPDRTDLGFDTLRGSTLEVLAKDVGCVECRIERHRFKSEEGGRVSIPNKYFTSRYFKLVSSPSATAPQVDQLKGY